MAPMTLGGLDGFLNVCRVLRTFDELKYAYPGTAGNYDDIDCDHPINVYKKNLNGGLCFMIETSKNETAYIGLTTLMDMLKYENLIISLAKKMQQLSNDIEKKFNDLINKAVVDLSTTLFDVDKSGDALLIEILSNFNDLFRLCIDTKTKNNENTSAGKKRRTRTQATSVKNKQAKLLEDDHSYAKEVAGGSAEHAEEEVQHVEVQHVEEEEEVQQVEE